MKYALASVGLGGRAAGRDSGRGPDGGSAWRWEGSGLGKIQRLSQLRERLAPLEWGPTGGSLRQRLGAVGCFTCFHHQCLLFHLPHQARVGMIPYNAGELRMVIAKGMPQSS
jgi:hypothetical protein